MPIRSMAPQFGMFSPADLDFLQSVYDQATGEVLSVDDITMIDIAQAMFDAYNSGVIERSQLLGIAMRTLYRRTA